MSKNNTFKILTIILLIGSFSKDVYAQDASKTKHQKYADSLIGVFCNTIYRCGYNPGFWAKCYTPVFTTIKIDIDKKGKLSGVEFSDSADSLFKAEFSKGLNHERDKQILEEYAKAEQLKNVSILIPVYYEPWADVKYKFHLNYGAIEGLLRFNKKPYRGNAIVLPPVRIPVLSTGNS